MTPSKTENIIQHAECFSTGRENLENIGVKAPVIGVFLCPSFRQVFSLVSSVMAVCSGQVKAWPVPISGILTPLQPATTTP